MQSTSRSRLADIQAFRTADGEEGWEVKEHLWGVTKHRAWVFWYCLRFAVLILWRGIVHDPEHHKNGLAGMSPVDVVEMMADWRATVRRQRSGDIQRSVVMNAERFSYDETFTSILVALW